LEIEIVKKHYQIKRKGEINSLFHTFKGEKMELENLLTYQEGKDTRDDSLLHIYKINKDLPKEEYVEINKEMKSRNCYYSKFVKGFICRVKLDLEIKPKKETELKETKNIKYKDSLYDYITYEEYEAFLIEYAKNNYKYGKYYHWEMKEGETPATKYRDELLTNCRYAKKYESFAKLERIREAIVEKSVGLSKENFYANGSNLMYQAIWDKLPTIPGIFFDTNKAYTAIWGYDQTNVSIAYQLNTRLWGLDVLREDDGRYYFVRIKEGRFHDKNGVKYFSFDNNPNETFKRDASVTGQYR
jgi:hypothetical protein